MLSPQAKIRIATTVFSLTLSSAMYSQTGYIERLQAKISGCGEIVIRQDARITRLLESDAAFANSDTKKKSESDKATTKHNGKTTENNSRPKRQVPDSLALTDTSSEYATNNSGHVRRYKTEGYRIQIYAGNNSRKSRIGATQAAQKIKGYFPELSVYTHFYPPRWICRVGDFRTAEDAGTYLSEIRKLNVFSGVTLIKTTIQVSY